MSKKILMVTMSLNIGGAETHVMELTKELKHMGYDVHVASNGGVYADELIAEGVPHYQIPLHKRKLGAMIRSYRMLSQLIRRENFDIVHGHARIPSFLCGLLHKRYGFRFVTTAHLDFLVTPLLRKISNWGEYTLAVSEDIRGYLNKEYGVDPAKVAVTVNGVDMKRFSPDVDFQPLLDEFHLEKNRRRIVYISRIDSDRSAPAFHLAEIAPALRKEFPDTDFIIVGGGDDFQRLSTLAEKVNAEAAGTDPDHPLVTLTGPRSDINLFTAAADIFCGVSRSALEAMSAKCPVIITGNQGYLGIFNESSLETARNTNFCCRGCALPTKEQLYEDLRKELLCSDEERAQQGEYNRQIIADYYSVRRMAEDYLAVYDQLPPATVFRKSDVVISGYYGFNNSGDDMILQALIEGLRRENSNVKIVALTKDPRRMSEEYHVRCVNRFNPFAVFRTVRRSHLVIFGGGTLLQDRTSTKSLKYYSFIIRLAHWAKTPLYVYANGIGPLDKEGNRKLVANVLRRVSAITVREPDSRQELIRMGIPGEKVSVTADPVFLLDSVDAEDVCHRLLEKGKRYFAVSLREYRWGAVSKENFEKTITETVKAIRDTYGLIPVFIPMQREKDYVLCDRIRKKTGGESVFAASLSTAETVSLISCMELVIGMRLHSLIFAAKEGVPMIGLAYDPKIHGFMNYIEEPYSFSMEDVTSEALLAAVADIMTHYDGFRRHVSESSSLMREKAHGELNRVTNVFLKEKE